MPGGEPTSKPGETDMPATGMPTEEEMEPEDGKSEEEAEERGFIAWVKSLLGV